MNVRFQCPSCETTGAATEIDAGSRLSCRACSWQRDVADELLAGKRVARCLVCGSRDLYFRKDFPQRLGLGIVAAGIVLSSIAWSQYWVVTTFAILFATVLLDMGLYFLVGEALVCYCCGAEYRSVEPAEGQGRFELSVAERYRQQKARAGSMSNRDA